MKPTIQTMAGEATYEKTVTIGNWNREISVSEMDTQ